MAKKRGKKPPRVPGMMASRIEISDTHKTVHLTPEGVEAIKAQKEAFREKFGREPGPEDPVFFDPDCEEPTPLTEEKFRRVFTEAGARAGLDPKRVLATLDYFGSDEHLADLEASGVQIDRPE